MPIQSGMKLNPSNLIEEFSLLANQKIEKASIEVLYIIVRIQLDINGELIRMVLNECYLNTSNLTVNIK